MGEQAPFKYEILKNNRVCIFWKGKKAAFLKGAEAQKFIERAALAGEHELQIAMARVTGNFKRGNEK